MSKFASLPLDSSLSSINKRNTTNVRIIADSKNEKGNRLTTFILNFPRMILAELNTHRVFSRNSASSRAKPISVMLKEVMDNPFIPIAWMKSHTGMQGKEYFEGEIVEELEKRWLEARDRAVESVKTFLKVDGVSDVSKQLVNRILEPFMMHEVILSGTEFGNFFALRNHPEAEIHMQLLASFMLEEYNKSTPVQLKTGEWHIPFNDSFDMQRVEELALQKKMKILDVKLRICSARAARISYKLHGTEDKYDYLKDLELCDKLIESGHYSPLEHCAYACSTDDFYGNFRGFLQLRKTFDEDSKKDERVLVK